MDSPHTYECMGLTPEAAQLIYNDGKKIRDGIMEDYGEDFDSEFLECSLEAYLVKRVTEVCDEVLAAGDGDNWIEAMPAAGIKKELQDAIMDEEFEAIRGTQSLQGWLKEIFGNYFRTFEHMNESVLDWEEEYSSRLRLRGGAGEEDIAPPPPGHRALFKSIEFKQAQGIFCDNEIDLVGLVSASTPMDFSPYGGLYFTDTPWVAEVYANFAKRTCPPADIRTVEIHVPEDHFKRLKVWELEFNDIFKEIVWHSRRGKIIPKHLQKIQSDFRILHGPCTTRHSKNYAKMDWNEITERHLLTRMTTDEYGAPQQEVAMQYMWRGQTAVSELSRDCKDKTRLWKPLKGWSLVEEPDKDVSVREKNVLEG